MTMQKYGGTLVFSGRDALEEIEVVDFDNLRTLHFGNQVMQSSMYLDDPYALEMEYNRVMMCSLLFHLPQKVLLLGLGGGAKPKFLWKYLPRCCMDVVEQSPLVIDVSRRFFQVPNDRRMNIYQVEALSFLLGAQDESYDMIFTDLYISSGMSATVQIPEFFSLCHSKLLPGGILIWNLWRYSNSAITERCMTGLTASFGKNYLCLPNQESPNLVIMAFKEPLPRITKKGIIGRSKDLFAETKLDFPKIVNELKFFKGYGSIFQNL